MIHYVIVDKLITHTYNELTRTVGNNRRELNVCGRNTGYVITKLI